MEDDGRFVWPPLLELKTQKLKNELLKVLQIIRLGKGPRANVIAKKLGKSIASTERYIKLLKSNDLIEFIGAPKTGGYYLVD